MKKTIPIGIMNDAELMNDYFYFTTKHGLSKNFKDTKMMRKPYTSKINQYLIVYLTIVHVKE